MKKAINLINRRIAVRVGSIMKGIKAGWKPTLADRAMTTMSKMADRR